MTILAGKFRAGAGAAVREVGIGEDPPMVAATASHEKARRLGSRNLLQP